MVQESNENHAAKVARDEIIAQSLGLEGGHKIQMDFNDLISLKLRDSTREY
jgi:hypothetical protein